MKSFIERQKKSAQKCWSKDLVYEKTFRLLSSTTHAFTIYYELIKINFQSLKFLTSTKKSNDKKKRKEEKTKRN